MEIAALTSRLMGTWSQSDHPFSVEDFGSGTLSINDTLLDRVGPLILEEDDASIILGGDTEFTNSTDDHDVRVEVSQPLCGAMMS